MGRGRQWLRSLYYPWRLGQSIVSLCGPRSGTLCFDLLFSFRIGLDDDNEMFDKVVSGTGYCLMSVRRINQSSSPYLLNMTTTQDTITGDPIICRMTKIVCCHAVRELRSIGAKPVPVAALTQTKRESMYRIRNFPLDAQKIMDQKRGIMRLGYMQGVIRDELVLRLKSAHSQGKDMDPEEIQVGFEPGESHRSTAKLQVVGERSTMAKTAHLPSLWLIASGT